MKNGLIWRVGDGTTINIWSDPWIPNKVTRRPITPRGRTVLSKVSDLISPLTGTWDEELIADVFWPEDAQYILAIPVKLGYEDSVAWHFDPRGAFSVKSAYHVLEDKREQQKVRQSGSSSTGGVADENDMWGRIWKIDCIPKIKQFFWRFAHNSLPLRMNIVRKGMDIDPRCPVCRRLDEDGGHCFLKCKEMKKCWQALNMEMEDIRLQLLGHGSAREVADAILHLKGDRRQLAICLLWARWMNRNKVNAGEVGGSVDDVTRKAILFASSAYELQDKPTQGANQGRRVKQHWCPSPPDFLKINFDGAFRDTDKSGAWGFLIRDSDGHGVLAGAGRLRAGHDALAAEGEACLAGLKAAMDWGISRIAIETDSVNLVAAINSDEFVRAPGGVIFKDLRVLLSLHFVVFSFCTCPSYL